MITQAAVKIFDFHQNKELIIPCHRHCDAFQILKEFGYCRGISYKEIAQGFLDEHGNWYSRTEAFSHAVKCKQIEEVNDIRKELYSEDLY